MFFVVIEIFMNGFVGVYKMVCIDIMCGIWNIVDMYDFDYWFFDLFIGIYGCGMWDEFVIVVFYWFFWEYFFCYVVVGDDFISCWFWFYFVFVDWVVLCED